MNTAATWFAAAVIAIAIAASSQLDGPDDNQAEWDQSAALKELQASEAGTARREAAAQALCNQERGPHSEARWLSDGSLACTTARRVVRASL